MTETYYTVDELAGLLKLSRWTVIRRFEHEPGVVDMGSPTTSKRARRYRVLRIPQSAVNRVLNRRKVVQ